MFDNCAFAVRGRGRGFGRGRAGAGSDMAINEVGVRGKITVPRTSCRSHVDSAQARMTSPPPLIFKRTKSKPAQRKRDASPEDVAIREKKENTEKGGDSEESPSILAAKLKSKVKKNKAKSKLSFGGDDDEVCNWSVCLSIIA